VLDPSPLSTGVRAADDDDREALERSLDETCLALSVADLSRVCQLACALRGRAR
jgi:hypothetical protein